jgi:hypothetical protein
MKLLYIEATHIFNADGRRYSVTLRPTGEAYVNGELVGRYDRPNTTMTRARDVLKHWQNKQTSK